MVAFLTSGRWRCDVAPMSLRCVAPMSLRWRCVVAATSLRWRSDVQYAHAHKHVYWPRLARKEAGHGPVQGGLPIDQTERLCQLLYVPPACRIDVALELITENFINISEVIGVYRSFYEFLYYGIVVCI